MKGIMVDGEGRNSQTPDINLWPVLPARDEEFRSCILWTATVGLQQTAWSLCIAQSKIWRRMNTAINFQRERGGGRREVCVGCCTHQQS